VLRGGRTALHLHRTSDEVIHIVSGEFTVRLGEVSQRVSAGAWVFVPDGTAHGWRNSGTEDGRAFFIFTPGDAARTFKEIWHEDEYTHEINQPKRELYFERYGMELIGQEWT
jgi:quercetin dioxygenase-like cupin family protein